MSLRTALTSFSLEPCRNEENVCVSKVSLFGLGHEPGVAEVSLENFEPESREAQTELEILLKDWTSTASTSEAKSPLLEHVYEWGCPFTGIRHAKAADYSCSAGQTPTEFLEQVKRVGRTKKEALFLGRTGHKTMLAATAETCVSCNGWSLAGKGRSSVPGDLGDKCTDNAANCTCVRAGEEAVLSL